ncbi:unnamed protein product [Adineta steineri]|uniref:Uncharacterized protein n=1 Tax=Adineta steineri TaxID=433720 RepID=A0A814T9L1_9BILA|nr:unnamed protein product [Adineta steineri]
MKRFSTTMLMMVMVLMVAISMTGKVEAECCSVVDTTCCCKDKAGKQVKVGKNPFNGAQFTTDGGTCTGCQIGYKC